MQKKNIILIVISALALIVLTAGVVLVLKSVFKPRTNEAVSGKITSGFHIDIKSISGSKGNIVKVPVEMSGNPGTMGYLLQFNYDKDSLTYTGFEKGDTLTDCEVSDKDGTLKLIDVEENDTTKDGVIVYLNFRIADNAKKGTTKIKLICDQNSICNFKEENISAKVNNGIITIK